VRKTIKMQFLFLKVTVISLPKLANSYA